MAPTRSPARRHGDIFPDKRHGFEPALDKYELHQPVGDGGPPRWHAAYSQGALADSIRGPRHEFNMRNPELSAQMDVMADSIDRVQDQALALRRATGRNPVEDERPLRTDLECELQALTHQNQSLSLTVAALVQSLVGLGATSFNWSQGLGTPRRKGLAELVLSYTKPLSHIDNQLLDLCTDLSVELAKDRLDDIPPMPWAMAHMGEALGMKSQRDGRSPPPAGVGVFPPASPQKSKFSLKGPVQGSLQAWKETEEDVITPALKGPKGMHTDVNRGASPINASPDRVNASPDSVISQQCRLKITILHAQGLRAGGMLDKSDPYCICEIPGKKGSTVQTKVINNTVTPTWNQSFLVDYAVGDSLKFGVWDSDVGMDDLLGVVLLEQGRFFPSGFNGALDLDKGGKGSKDPKLSVKIEVVEEAEPGPEISPMKFY